MTIRNQGWAYVSGSSTGTPGGSNTQIQYNAADALGGSPDLTWDGSTIATTGVSASVNISASAFYGDGSNLTSISSDDVDTATDTTNTTRYIPFVANATGTNAEILLIDDAVTINPSSGVLTVAGDITSSANISASVGVTAASFAADGAAVLGGSLTAVGVVAGGAISAATTISGSGVLSAASLSLDSVAVTSTAAEINYLDNDDLTAADITKLAALTATATQINYNSGVTAGTAIASKSVVLDASKDVTGINELTASYFSGDGSGLINLPGGGLLTAINGTQAYLTSSLAIGGSSAPDHTLSISGSVSGSGIVRAASFAADGTAVLGGSLTAVGVVAGGAISAATTISGSGVLSAASLSLGSVAVTATAAEINYLDNDDLTAADITKLAALTATAAEINYLDNADLTAANIAYVAAVTAGTAIASKAVVLDASKNTTGINQLTASYFKGDGSGLTGISSDDVDTTANSGSSTRYIPFVANSGSTDGESLLIHSAVSINPSTGVFTVAGSAPSLGIGSAVLVEADLEKLDGITNGTAVASKAVVLDGSKNIATLGTVGCGAITSTGASTMGSLNIGGTLACDTSFTLDAVAINATELGYIDGVTAGTAAASKSVVLDASKDVTGISSLTASYFKGDGSGLTNVPSGVTGSNTQVQFNQNGEFGANAGFTFDGTGSVATTVKISSAALSASAAVTGASFAADGAAVLGGSLTAAGVVAGGAISSATSIDGSGDLTMGTITMTGFSVDADGDVGVKTLDVNSGGITDAGPVSGVSTFDASGLASLDGGIDVNGKMTVSTSGSIAATGSLMLHCSESDTGLQVFESSGDLIFNAMQGGGQGIRAAKTITISGSSQTGLLVDSMFDGGIGIAAIGAILAGHTGGGVHTAHISNDGSVSGSAGLTMGTTGVFGGDVGIRTTTPTEALDINSDAIRIRTAQTPASAAATGTVGMVCWDSNYIYICIATDTWKRVAIGTW